MSPTRESSVNVGGVSRADALLALIAEDPDDPFLLYALAMEHGKLGQEEEALAGFQRVLDGHPGYVPAYFHYARLLADRGDPATAVQVIQRGLKVAEEAGEGHAAAELRELLDEVG